MVKDDRPTVYSSAYEDLKPCPKCGRIPCRCPKPASLPPNQQTIFIRRETKGRGGKTVVVLYNFQLTNDDLGKLAKTLKQTCGTGGTTRDDTIEIQGDHRDKLAEKLRSLGYKTKFTGG